MFGSRQTEKLGEGVSVMKKIIAEYTFSAEERLRVKALAKCCGLHEVTASILYSRGVDTPEKAERFLHPSRKNLLSPFLMRGMRELKEDRSREVGRKAGRCVRGLRCGRDRSRIHSDVGIARLRGALYGAYTGTFGGVRNDCARAGKADF